MISPLGSSSPQSSENEFSSLKERVVKNVHSKSIFCRDWGVKGELRSLKPIELKNLVGELALQFDKKEMSSFLEMISLEDLQYAIREEFTEHTSALETAKGMFHEAKFFLETTESHVSPSLKTRLIGVLNGLISVLETILGALGLAEFFQPAKSSAEAESKSSKIFTSISNFSIVPTIVAILLGFEPVPVLVIGSIILGIVILSILYPYIKPQATVLPRAENWSQKYLEGNLEVIDGRKGTLDEIANTLIGSKNAKMHVMLIGKRGIGKTETAKAFVQAVERGAYPELKGKKIHYMNTADLVGGSEILSSQNNILSQISNWMGRHRENYILILDEIHMACKKHHDTIMADQLKAMLDPGKESFPYVIGITTEEAFFQDIYSNQAAFAKRFKRITISNAEDEETLKTLNAIFLKKAPHALIEEGALRSLLTKAKNTFGEEAPQPATCLTILSQCIHRISDVQRSPLEVKVEKFRGKIQSLYSERSIGQGKRLLPYVRLSENQSLEKELIDLEAKLLEQKKELDLLYQNRTKLAELKAAMYRTAVKTAKIGQGALSSSDQADLKEFLVQSHFQAPALEAKIREEANRIGVKVVIDEALIDEVIAAEKENEKRAEEMVKNRKEQFAAREE